jgi:hypothetical protein
VLGARIVFESPGFEHAVVGAALEPAAVGERDCDHARHAGALACRLRCQPHAAAEGADLRVANAVSSQLSGSHDSRCSASATQNGMDYCERNRPKPLESPPRNGPQGLAFYSSPADLVDR